MDKKTLNDLTVLSGYITMSIGLYLAISPNIKRQLSGIAMIGVGSTFAIVGHMRYYKYKDEE